jgi:hypothetical protein
MLIPLFVTALGPKCRSQKEVEGKVEVWGRGRVRVRAWVS